MGTDKTPLIIENIVNYVEKKGIKIGELTEVIDIEKKGNKFLLKTSRGEIESRIVIAAPGRAGAKWFYEQAKKLGVDTIPFSFGDKSGQVLLLALAPLSTNSIL